MNGSIRVVTVLTALACFAVSAALFFQVGFASALWPWPDSNLSFVFLASIVAASAASILWIGLSGDTRATAPGSLEKARALASPPEH